MPRCELDRTIRRGIAERLVKARVRHGCAGSAGGSAESERRRNSGRGTAPVRRPSQLRLIQGEVDERQQ